MFWKLIVGAILLPSCLGFEPAAAHLANKVQNQPQSQELANQSVVNSCTLGDEADTQVKQTKYEYYRHINRQNLHRYRQRLHRRNYRNRTNCPQNSHLPVHHRRYYQNTNYHRRNHHPRQNHYRYQRQHHPNQRPRYNHRQYQHQCQYYSHGRCYN